MQTDPSLTTAAPNAPETAAGGLPPTPIGLIGLAAAPIDRVDRPLQMPPPRRWRVAKYALGVVIPVGLAFGAHRLSTPDGLDAAELPSRGIAGPSAPVSSAPTRIGNPPPPSHSFERGAFGHSGAVRIRVVLPGEPVDLAMQFGGATDSLTAQWVSFDGKADEPAAPFPASGSPRAPSRPGAFWLTVSRGGVVDTIADMAVLVEHPMPNKLATGINGYHLGRWPKAADGKVPPGFIEVTDRISGFPLSPHLRMSDFIVHDEQTRYPKYLHVREALLDKIELTINEIAGMRNRPPEAITLYVASGFRSPSHNGRLSGTAGDSRHMYGDAADIAIDANSDGKLTEIDARLVAAAAEVVERKYPDLVGGIGLYITPEGGGWPYVHLDVRGNRARWRAGTKKGGKVDSLPPNASFDSVPRATIEASALPPGVIPESLSARIGRRPQVRPIANGGRSGSLRAPSVVRTTRTALRPATKAKPMTAARTTTKKPAKALTKTMTAAASGTRSRSSAKPPAAASRRVGATSAAAAPTVDDPFAAAARKFRAARP